MAIFYLKNVSGAEVLIEDLGILLPDSTSIPIDSNNINGWLTTDLNTALNNGSLILSTTDVGDNSGDLSASNAIKALTITSEYDTDNPHQVTFTQAVTADPDTDITAAEAEELTDGSDTSLHIHDNRYYTKINLQTPGESTVDWNNVVNAPTFGALEWKEPVICNLHGMGSTPPSTPETGWFYLDTDDKHLYKYDGSGWVDQGAPNVGDRVIFRDGSGSDDNIYEFDGTNWNATAPQNNWAVIVNDDGDGNKAQYVYNNDGSPPDWVKIGDVDWGEHNVLNGRELSGAHPATAIDYNNSISGLTSTTVQNAIDELAAETDIKIDNIVYVSKNGSDTPSSTQTTADLGTITSPYATISAAISSISDASSTKRYLIYIFPGTYTESITLSTSYIYLKGASKETTIIQTQDTDTIVLNNTDEKATGIIDLTIINTSSASNWNCLNISANNPILNNLNIIGKNSAKSVYITSSYVVNLFNIYSENNFQIDAGTISIVNSDLNNLLNITGGSVNLYNVNINNINGDAISQSGGVLTYYSGTLHSESSSKDILQTSGDCYLGNVKYDTTKLAFSGNRYTIFYSKDLGYDNSTSGLTANNVQDAIDEIDTNVDTVTTDLTGHTNDTGNPHQVTFTQAVAADSGTDITVTEAETLTDGSNADSLHTHNADNINYNNSGSLLSATNVQAAIDELAAETNSQISNILFVAKNGSDTPLSTQTIADVGTLAYPFATVQAAINRANNLGLETVIFIFPGVYSENLVSYNNIHLIAYEPGTVIIGNSGSHSISIGSNTGKVYLKNIDFTSIDFTISHTTGNTGSLDLRLNNCTFGNLTINGLGEGDKAIINYNTIKSLILHSISAIVSNNNIADNAGTSLTVDDNNAEIWNVTTGQASDSTFQSNIFKGSVSFSNKTTSTLLSNMLFDTLTITGTDCIVNSDNSSLPDDTNITINSGTLNYIDNSFGLKYNNTTSGLTANNVQAAIDELNTKIEAFDIPKGTSFPSSPDDGDLFYRTDLAMSFQYDGTRGKWLSLHRQLIDFGNNRADGKYLAIHNSQSTSSGYLMPRNGVILSITAKAASGNLSKSFQVRKNHDFTSLKIFSLNSGVYSSTSEDIAFNAADYIQVYCDADGTAVKDIIVVLEIAYTG